MRRKLTFVCEEHEDYGQNGWKLKGAINADPLGGMAVAHDCLEHRPNGDMGVEDELMALGASLYVRYYTKNMHSLGANVGADLPDVLRHVTSVGMPLRDPGRTKAIEAEGEIDDAINALLLESQYDDDLEITEEQKGFLRGWFRRGYRWAEKRYKGIQRDALRYMFDEIEAESDRLLRHAEIGDEMLVRWSFDGSYGQVKARLVPAENW